MPTIKKHPAWIATLLVLAYIGLVSCSDKKQPGDSYGQDSVAATTLVRLSKDSREVADIPPRPSEPANGCAVSELSGNRVTCLPGTGCKNPCSLYRFKGGEPAEELDFPAPLEEGFFYLCRCKP